MNPVTPERIKIASKTLDNADLAAKACRTANLPFFVACALLQQETGGKNVWGGDAGAVNRNLHNKPVTPEDFMRFIIPVIGGSTSNGVGPCQITYAGSLKNGHRDGGHFAVMADRGLLPWNAHDNMVYGFSLFADSHKSGESWGDTYARYNGGPNPNAIARDRGRAFTNIVDTWKKRLGI